MAPKPEISFISSALRPQNWMAFYGSIAGSRASFELVFVGPNEPEYALPGNFHFIQSRVKPTQCFEIALRNSKADLVMYVADDFVFVTENPIDKLLELYRSVDDPRCMISPRHMMNGNDHSDAAHHFFYGIYFRTVLLLVF